MNWLLRTFLPYVVFGIIVVFQAEIRKVLAHLGKAPLPRPSARRAREEVIDEVVLAATTPQPRSARAPSSSSSATWACAATSRPASRLDALVTYDLLISIFNPGTPLHDGAVIVQGNRIAAAACFLPLTVNPELSRTLGSRHRAAIGVTEDTDAAGGGGLGGDGRHLAGRGRPHPPRAWTARALKPALLRGARGRKRSRQARGRRAPENAAGAADEAACSRTCR